MKTRKELVRLNNAVQSFEPIPPPASRALREVSDRANTPYQEFPARRKYHLPLNRNMNNGKAIKLAAERKKLPIYQPQKSSSSGNTDPQKTSNSQSMFSFTIDEPEKNDFASTSTASDNYSINPREFLGHQSSRYAAEPSSRNGLLEESRHEVVENNDMYQRPQNARVGLKKNAWTKQTQLCFRPLKPPPNGESFQSSASNQIDTRYDPSMVRTPLQRTMQPYGYAPMQQNSTWRNRPMSSRPLRMQQYSNEPSPQGLFYHGQMVSNRIVEQELRARAAELSTPPDVKPIIHRRQMIRNDIEQGNDEVQSVDRRQALYPGVYEQDDGEL